MKPKSDNQLIEEAERKTIEFARKRVESVRLLFTPQNFIPPRAWYIYYACLEKPKSLKMIAKELDYKGQSGLSNKCGYINQSALSQHYKGKPFSDWLIEKGLIEFSHKKSREIFYKSNPKFLVEIYKKIFGERV